MEVDNCWADPNPDQPNEHRSCERETCHPIGLCTEHYEAITGRKHPTAA